MGKVFALLGAPFAYLPFCSLPGAVIGALTGLVMSVVLVEPWGEGLVLHQLAVIALLCAALAWVTVLFLFGVLLRYSVAALFWPALAAAVGIALAVVIVNRWLDISAACGVVGVVLGIVLGALACRMWCRDGVDARG